MGLRSGLNKGGFVPKVSTRTGSRENTPYRQQGAWQGNLRLVGKMRRGQGDPHARILQPDLDGQGDTVVMIKAIASRQIPVGRITQGIQYNDQAQNQGSHLADLGLQLRIRQEGESVLLLANTAFVFRQHIDFVEQDRFGPVDIKALDVIHTTFF